MMLVYTENFWCFLGRFEVSFLCCNSVLNAKETKLHSTELEKLYANEKTLPILAVTLPKTFNFATEDVYKLIHKAWRRVKKMSHSSKDLIQKSLTLVEILIKILIKTMDMVKTHQ